MSLFETSKNPITHTDKDPEVLALYSKLIARNDIKKDPALLISNFENLVNNAKSKSSTNQDILKLFPETAMLIQVIIANILSPNDLQGSKLTITNNSKLIPSGIRTKMLSIVKNYVVDNYKLDSKLPDILEKTLFLDGAYCEAIIPEASVDDFINRTKVNAFEHISSTPLIGILDGGVDSVTNGVTTENIAAVTTSGTKAHTADDMLIEFIDNYAILTAPAMLKKNTKDSLKNSIYPDRIALESNDNTLDMLFKNNTAGNSQEYFVTVNTKENASRKSIGPALVFNIPAEYVIPIHVTNTPSEHIGYFILTDVYGNIINSDTSNMASTDTGSNSSNLISRAKNGLNNMITGVPMLNEMDNMYVQMVENLIKKRLETSRFGKFVQIDINNEIYRVMFNRKIAQQKTKLLFISTDMMQYYAYKFRDNGTGKSLLEDVAVMYSILAVLFFTNVVANIKNSTNITEYNVKIPDNDPDPIKTLEIIKSNFLATREASFPMGSINVNDLTSWAKTLGVKMSIEHPSFPQVVPQINNVNAGVTVPDMAFFESVWEKIIMGLGLTPELVKSGFSNDFATTFASKSLQFTKRVSVIHSVFEPQVNLHISKLCYNNESIYSALKEIISSGYEEIITANKLDKNNQTFDKDEVIEYLLIDFISNNNASFPAPDYHDAQNMKTAFSAYKDSVNEYVDLLLSSTALPASISGDLSNKLTDISAIIKTTLIRDWMATNNYMPEISQFGAKLTDDAPNKDIINTHSVFIKNVAEQILPQIQELETIKKQIAEAFKVITPESDGATSQNSAAPQADVATDTEYPSY